MAENLNDLFSPELLKRLEKLTQDSKELGSVYAKLAIDAQKANDSINRAISTSSNSQKGLNEAQKEALRISQALEKQDAKLANVTTKYSQELIKVQQQTQKQVAAQKNLIKYTDAEVGSVNRLNAANAILRQRKAAISGETEKGRQKIEAYNKAIDKNTEKIRSLSDATVKQKMQIGNYGSALDGVGSKVSAIAGRFLGWGMVVSGVGGFITNAVNKSMEFEVALDELSAITGATGKDLEYMKKQALELGPQFGKSGIEIVNAFKLVGSAKPELLNDMEALAGVTEAVLTLSKASGDDLATSTTSLVSIMNQFGASGNQAARYINVLAAGSKYGAAEIPALTEAMMKFGPVAKTAGISVERSAAMTELLAEKGLNAEKSGISLRNIILELMNDQKNYTNGVFDMNKGLESMKLIQNDAAAMTEKFGKENAVAALLVAQNTGRIKELEGALTGTKTASEQAEINSGNLRTKIDKLKASWEALTLNIMDSEGIFSKVLGGIVSFFTEATANMKVMNQYGVKFRQLKEDVFSKEQAAVGIKAFNNDHKTMLLQLEKGSITQESFNKNLAIKANLARLKAKYYEMELAKLRDSGTKAERGVAAVQLGFWQGYYDEINKYVQEEVTTTTEAADEEIKKTEEQTEKEKKLAEKRSEDAKKAAADLASWKQQLREAEIANIQDAYLRELATIENNYLKKVDQIKKEVTNNALKNELIEQAEIEHKQKLQEIDNRAFEKLVEDNKKSSEDIYEAELEADKKLQEAIEEQRKVNEERN